MDECPNGFVHVHHNNAHNSDTLSTMQDEHLRIKNCLYVQIQQNRRYGAKYTEIPPLFVCFRAGHLSIHSSIRSHCAPRILGARRAMRRVAETEDYP